VHKDKDGWYFFDYRKGTELRRAGDFIQPDYIETVIGKHQDVSEVCVYGIPASSARPERATWWPRCPLGEPHH